MFKKIILFLNNYFKISNKVKGNYDFQTVDGKFDELLFQVSKGNTFENYEKGVRYIGLEQVKEWKSRFGYKFSIYSNDHFINNKPHFHLDNEANEVHCKISFDGELFESKNKEIPKNIYKELKKFLSKNEIQIILKDRWNLMNPNLKV